MRRSIRFQRRRVDADGLPLYQARVGELLQPPREDRFVRFEIDQATCAGNRRMIRRRLGQHQAEKFTECERIRRTLCDGALGVQAFEVADQEQSRIAARRQTRPTDFVSA